MMKKISQLLFAISFFILSLSIMIYILGGESLFAKIKYEVPRKRLMDFKVFAYKDLLGLYEPAKGQIYFYKDNIYVKTFRIADPGANLMILY
jgi:hypothetical protein